MNFEQLKIFIAVVEHGSFTKAAETLYISHSTTSRNVAALEEYLDVRLLMRDNRSVRPTAAGEILYHEGAQLLQRAEELEATVKNAGRGLVGTLTVASINLYSYELSNGYKEFCSRYPDIVLGMYHRELSEIFGQVCGGEADLGVTFSYALPQDFGGYAQKPVAKEKFCVVTALNHPLALKKSVKIEELRTSSYVSVGVQRSEYARKLEDVILKDRQKSEILSVPTLESLFLQVRSGNGVSLVPYPMAYEYGDNCAILEVEDLDTAFDVVVFWRRDNENPSLPLLVELMSENASASRPEQLRPS